MNYNLTDKIKIFGVFSIKLDRVASEFYWPEKRRTFVGFKKLQNELTDF